MRNRGAFIVALGVLSAGMFGCDTEPASSSGMTTVTLVSTFSSASPSRMTQASGVGEIDQLVIDSAVVVFSKIKFESHLDSAVVDTSDDGEGEDDDEINVKFRGPFVVHIRDTVAIDFASQVLPPGTYNRIKFKVHRLTPGERHEHSDERDGRIVPVDLLPYGSSVTIWGRIWKDSVWSPFTFAYDGELEFKVRGDFTVSEATSSVTIALNIDMGTWFTTRSGQWLDPTDQSSHTRELIRMSIKRSFEQCRAGRDDDEDGHPDD